jgi:hypothetical protein
MGSKIRKEAEPMGRDPMMEVGGDGIKRGIHVEVNTR